MPSILSYLVKGNGTNDSSTAKREEFIKNGKNSLNGEYFIEAEEHLVAASRVDGSPMSDLKRQEHNYYLAVAQLGILLKKLSSRRSTAKEVLLKRRSNMLVDNDGSQVRRSFDYAELGPKNLPGVNYALHVLLPVLSKKIAEQNSGKDNTAYFKREYAKFKLYYLTKSITKEFSDSNNFDISVASLMLKYSRNVIRLKALAKADDDYLYFSKEKIKELYNIVLSSNSPDSLDDDSPFIKLKKHLAASLTPQQEKLFQIVLNALEDIDVLWLISPADINDVLLVIQKLQENNLWTEGLNKSMVAILSSADDFILNLRTLVNAILLSKEPEKTKLLKAVFRFALSKMPHPQVSDEEFDDYLDLITAIYNTPQNQEINLKRIFMYLDIFVLYSNQLSKDHDFSSVFNLISEAEKNLGEEVFAKLILRILNNKNYEKYFLPLIHYGVQLNKKHIESLLELMDAQCAWLKIKDRMKLVFWQAHQEKFPEKPLDIVIDEFAHTKFPLAADELAELRRQYEIINDFGREIISSSLSLPELLKDCQSALKKNPDDELQRLRLIALLREYIKEHFHIYPYNVQIINLLALLKDSKRIAQIKTGEGKSTLIAMLSAYHGLTSHKVDVVSTSNELAIRDAQKFKGFYKQLGLSVGHNAPVDGKHNDAVYDYDIVYGTNFNFEFAYLHQETGGRRGRGSRPYDVVIVDEVDSMFIDMKNNEAIISIPDENKQSTDVYRRIWRWINNAPPEKQTVKQLQAMLASPKEEKIKVGKLVKENKTTVEKPITVSLKQAKKWLDSAHTAKRYSEGVQYVIDKEENIDRVKIVDFRNTGQISSASSRWQNGLHSFVEAKHDLEILPESLTSASVNHIEFFNKYKTLVGLSGTVGSEVCRNELKELYDVDCYDSPTYKESAKKAVPNIIAKDEQEQTDEIEKMVGSMVKAGRPCLILCQTIEKSYEVYELLKKKHKKLVQLYNCRQEESSESLLALAGNPGMITVATNAAGRGTDIVVTPQAEELGGLHVVMTFPASNLRVEEQAFGRTGRQGRRGTFHYILNEDQLQEDAFDSETLCANGNEKFQAMEKNRAETEKSMSAHAIKYQGISHTQFVLQDLFFKLSKVYKINYRQAWAKYKTHCKEVAWDYMNNGGSLTLDDDPSLDPKSTDRYLFNNADVNKYFCKQFLLFWNNFMSSDLSLDKYVSPLDFAVYHRAVEAVALFQEYLPQLALDEKWFAELQDDCDKMSRCTNERNNIAVDDVDALLKLSLVARKNIAGSTVQSVENRVHSSALRAM